MTRDDYITDWCTGFDTGAHAMQYANQSGGRVSPADVMFGGHTLPGFSAPVHPVASGRRMSDLMPERMARARADIEQWNLEQSLSAVEWTAEDIQTLLQIAKEHE